MAWAVDFLSWRIGCKKQNKQVDQPRLHPPPLTHSQTLRWTSPGFTTARHQRLSSCSFPCQPWCLPPLLWLMNKGGHTQGGLDFLLLCLDVLCMCPTPVTTLCGSPRHGHPLLGVLLLHAVVDAPRDPPPQPQVCRVLEIRSSELPRFHSRF